MRGKQGEIEGDGVDQISKVERVKKGLIKGDKPDDKCKCF